MKIYHYDSNTKEYVGCTDARLDPLELQLKGKRVYMLPANATFNAPPSAVEGKMIIMADGQWKQIDIPKPIIVPATPFSLTKEELESQRKEAMIQTKIREMAISALQAEGKI